MPPVINATLITDSLRKDLQPELGLAVTITWKNRVFQQMLLQITEGGTKGKEKERVGKVTLEMFSGI